MDQFGIGAAITGAANVYFMSARRSGRTTMLAENVKDGDRVAFSTAQMAKRFEQMCKERGVKVECVVIPPKEPGRVFNRGTPRGRTFFDHEWLEQFYMDALSRAQQEIDHLERQASGHGTAHAETRRAAEEICKWRI